MAGTDFDAAITVASPNVRHVHELASRFDRVHAILGGFDSIFAGLVADTAYKFQPSSEPTNIASQLFENERSNPFAYSLWRGRLLQTISCRVGSEAIYSALSPHNAQRSEALRLWSDTLERAGRYSTSVRIMRQLHQSFDAQGFHDDALEAMFVIAGRRYTAARWIRFLTERSRYERYLEALSSQNILFDEALAEARSVYLTVLMLKLVAMIPLVGKRIQRRLGNLAPPKATRRAAECYYSRGDWQEVRLLRGAADDLGQSLEVHDPNGSSKDADLLLTSVYAFTHGNNVVGQASAYRRTRCKTRKRCEELLEALAAFGHSAEFWKFFVSSINALSVRKRRCYVGLAFFELWSCQYPFVIKLAYTVRLSVVSTQAEVINIMRSL